MDLSKASNTINHDLLIAKLHDYGFDKNSFSLVKSYFTDKWQRTKGSWLSLTVGVPQGSVLGLLLFNLLISDLFYIVCNYANDNTLYTCDMNLETLMNKLESATKNALDWFRSNGMKLISSKCEVLVCGHTFESMICKIENAQVMETHIVKLLGIQIDTELTFNIEINTLCNKASQKLNVLSRLCFFYHSIDAKC